MKAIILAAGRGSRMGDKTAEIPKGMVALWGKTLLRRAQETLIKAGISEIGIITGYMRDKIDLPNVKTFVNEQWESTNMLATLLCAEDWFSGEDVIVCYSDIVFSASAITSVAARNSDVVLPYYTGFWELWNKRFENPLDDLETFIVDENGSLTEIGKRTNDISQIHGQYMGLIKFSPNGWQNVKKALQVPAPKTVDKMDMTTLLNHMLTLGYSIDTVACAEPWLEVDNQHDLELYENGNIPAEFI